VGKRKKSSKAEYNKKKKAKKVISFPSSTSVSSNPTKQKLSDIIQEIALHALKSPDENTSEPAMRAAFMLATAAWNSTVGDDDAIRQYHEAAALFGRKDALLLEELKSNNAELLINKLSDYKQEHFPHDLRRVVATEMTPEGHFRVHWSEPNNLTTASFGAPPSQKNPPGPRRRGPIATKLVKKMKQYVRAKVVDLNAVMTGHKNAEELQKTVATQERLADHHPAHAIYVYAQNQTSVMVEQLTALKEMDRFTKLISKAEEEYMPSGPPMSPLTHSFFTCWAFFDACVGKGQETLGTIAMAVGSAFGMNKDLVRVIGLMQDSKMAVYAHEGFDRDKILLQELVTNRVCKAICPSGYKGHKGELWYARVLPPPLPELEEHVVFTTPYLLIKPGEREWLAYFQRTLADTPITNRIAEYEKHMKFGPARDYWTEFVFEAYMNHRPDVIFLEGLPDIPESRPHSSVNS
jgi:hypothetical protein